MKKTTEFITVPELAKKLGLTRQGAAFAVERAGVQFAFIGRMRVLSAENLKELMRLRAKSPQVQQKRSKARG